MQKNTKEGIRLIGVNDNVGQVMNEMALQEERTIMISNGGDLSGGIYLFDTFIVDTL